MKSYKKVFSAILAATIIATSSAFSTSAASHENIIYYDGTAYSTDVLSERTIEWIKAYNELPRAEQELVNSIPPEILALTRSTSRSTDAILEAGYDDNNTSFSRFRAASSLLPTSGGEPVYNPEYWNDASRIKRANCYAYSMDVISSAEKKLQPGAPAGAEYTRYTPENIKAAAFKDGPYLGNGRSMAPTTSTATSTSKSYKVALVVTEENIRFPDYHWYVQNSDGYWSHKRGDGKAQDVDASGNYITDPQTCDRDYISYNYNVWGGYIMVTRL